MQFRRIGQSGTLSLNEKCALLEQAGRSVCKFGFGESPFLPLGRVRQALQAASCRKDYTAVAGLPELRGKIAAFHCEADGYPIAAEQVLVAPGSKPLIYSLMHAFSQAIVFLPAPGWLSYAPQARLAGHEVALIPSSHQERWRLAPAALDEILSRHSQTDRHKIAVLNYPGNPDGLTYSRAELEALADVFSKHGVWVISDEIYALLHHQGRHISLASIYPQRTLVTTGLSKWCGAGGWRLGALILPSDAPDGLYDALVGLASEIYSCASVPIQAAALSAYELDAELHRYLTGQRQILAAIGQTIHAALVERGLRAHPPQGGFYLLLDFSPFAESLAGRAIVTDRQLCEGLLEDSGVALLPGSAFGLPADALTARLAYVDFDGAALLDRWDALDDGQVKSSAAKMLKGIDRLGDWLH